jgi:hypothetical protein
LPKLKRGSTRPSADRRTNVRGSKADRKWGSAVAEPAFVGQDNRAGERGELLEVHGFDLLAQIEAMLRHAREYQREVQRLRGILGKGQTATSDMAPLAAVRHHLEEMQHAYGSFGDSLTDARRIAASL